MNDTGKSYPAVKHARHFLLALAVVTLVAGAIRLGMTAAFVGLGSPPDAGASPDQLEYDAILRQLAAGNGYAKHDGTPTARRAPGMVLTLLPGYALSGGSYALARLTLVALSTATCLLVGLTVARVFSARAGLIAAALLAIMPGHMYYAMHLLSEAPFGFWLALAVYLSVVAMQRQHQRLVVFLAAGLCWGVAVLCRPQFVLLAPLVVVAASVLAWRQASWRPALAGAACLAAAAALVMPWYVRNAVVLDAPGLSTGGGYGLWAGNNELVLDDPAWRGRAVPTSKIEATLGVKLPEGEAASNAQAKAYAKAFMRDHRAEMPVLTLWKLYRLATPFHPTENRVVYWAQAVSWIAFVPWLVAGVVIGLKRRPAVSLILLAPMAVTVGVTLVFFAIGRYRDALLPVMVPFAALALDAAWYRLARGRAPGPAGSIHARADPGPTGRLAA